MRRGNKYGAKPLWYCRDGCGSIATVKPIKGACLSCGSRMAYFASKREYELFSTVELRERLGEVVDVKLQPAFPMVINGVKIANPFRADFAFTDVATGYRHIVDVKGVETREAKLRRKLAEALHYVEIEVWR